MLYVSTGVRVQPRHQRLEHHKCDEYGPNVQHRVRIQPRHQRLEHRERDKYAVYVQLRARVQPRHHGLGLFQCLVVEQHVSECRGVACWLQED